MPQQLLTEAERILTAYQMAERNYRPEALKEERKKAVKKLDELARQNTQHQSAYKDQKQAEFNAAHEKLDELKKEVKVFSFIKNGKVDYEALNKAQALKQHFSDHIKQLQDKTAVETALAEVAEVNDATVIQAFKMAFNETPPAFFHGKEREYYMNNNVFIGEAPTQNITWHQDKIQELNDVQLGITHPDIKVAQANFNLARELLSNALSGKSEIGDKITVIREQVAKFGESY